MTSLSSHDGGQISVVILRGFDSILQKFQSAPAPPRSPSFSPSVRLQLITEASAAPARWLILLALPCLALPCLAGLVLVLPGLCLSIGKVHALHKEVEKSQFSSIIPAWEMRMSGVGWDVDVPFSSGCGWILTGDGHRVCNRNAWAGGPTRVIQQ